MFLLHVTFCCDWEFGDPTSQPLSVRTWSDFRVLRCVRGVVEDLRYRGVQNGRLANEITRLFLGYESEDMTFHSN